MYQRKETQFEKHRKPRSGNAAAVHTLLQRVKNSGVWVYNFLSHMLWQIVCTGIHLTIFYPTIVSESNLWKKGGGGCYRSEY